MKQQQLAWCIQKAKLTQFGTEKREKHLVRHSLGFELFVSDLISLIWAGTFIKISSIAAPSTEQTLDAVWGFNADANFVIFSPHGKLSTLAFHRILD